MVLSVSASFGTSTVQQTPNEPGAAQLGCNLAGKKIWEQNFSVYILTPSTQYSTLKIIPLLGYTFFVVCFFSRAVNRFIFHHLTMSSLKRTLILQISATDI